VEMPSYTWWTPRATGKLVNHDGLNDFTPVGRTESPSEQEQKSV